MVVLRRSIGPFWRWTVNLGVGRCPVGCLYCYCLLHEWAKCPFELRPDVQVFEKQLAHLVWLPPAEWLQYRGQWDIMMSSSHDPFAPSVQAVADDVLTAFDFHPEAAKHLRVLSKCWGQGFLTYALPRNALYGATITTLDNDVSRAVQPNATIPSWENRHLKTTNLIDELIILSNVDLKIWVSSEPMLRGMDLRQAASDLEECGAVPVEWWVGRYNQRGPVAEAMKDLALSDEEIRRQFQEASDSFPEINWYLKGEVTNIPVPEVQGE